MQLFESKTGHLLLFHCNNGYTKAPQCYVTLTLPVLLGFAMAFHAVGKPIFSVGYEFWGFQCSFTLTVFWHVGLSVNGGSRFYPNIGTSLLDHMVSQPTGPKNFYYLYVLFEFCDSAK